MQYGRRLRGVTKPYFVVVIFVVAWSSAGHAQEVAPKTTPTSTTNASSNKATTKRRDVTAKASLEPEAQVKQVAAVSKFHIWSALRGGFGKYDADDEWGEGRYTTAIVGGDLGLGAFTGEHAELGFELSYVRYVRLATIKQTDTLVKPYGTLTPRFRVTGYLGPRAGPFVSTSLLYLVFVDEFSLELGYAWPGLIGHGRTSLAIGFEQLGTASFSGSSNAERGYLLVRVDLTK